MGLPSLGDVTVAGVLLLRHGETALNASGRYQGWLDPSLSDAGSRQAREAGRSVRRTGFRPGVVWSSDLRRATETARLAFPGVPVRIDPRLRELRFGVWEGRTREDARARHPEAFGAWIRDPEGTAPPGGETLPQLRERLDRWWRDATSCAGQGTDLLTVVGHGGPLRVLLARLLGIPPAWRWESALRIGPGAVVRVGPRSGSERSVGLLSGAGHPGHGASVP